MDKACAYNGQQLTTAKAEGKMEKQEEIGLAEINQFAAKMDHFSDCVIQNKRPFTPGEEGLQDHCIMEAIYRSAKDGHPVEIKSVNSSNWNGPEPEGL
ncbi:Gfo/Idh/MocA family oxidoreductase [Mucilaginibacter phyllosphaerae]